MAHAVVVEKPKGDKANNEPVFLAMLFCLAFNLVRSFATRETIASGMLRPASRDQNPELFWFVISGQGILVLFIVGILVHGRWFK